MAIGWCDGGGGVVVWYGSYGRGVSSTRKTDDRESDGLVFTL